MQEDLNSIESEEESNYQPYVRKDILNDYDIPYEIRMKYIIKAYRKDQEKWARFVVQAKHIQELLSDSKKRVLKQNEQICELQKELKLYKSSKKHSSALESHMVSSLFSEDKVDNFKKIIENQSNYIRLLQELLYKNNIAYPPLKLK